MTTTPGLTPELYRDGNRQARLKLIMDAMENEELEHPNEGSSLSRYEGSSLSRCLMVLYSLANRFVVDPNIQALGSKSLPKAPRR